MEIKNLLIGIMAAVLFTGLSLGIMFELYDSENLNVDLSQDSSTGKLSNLSARINQSRSDLSDYNDVMENDTQNAQFDEQTDSQDLLQSAWSAFKNVPSYIGTFSNLIFTIASMVLPKRSGEILWFILGLITIVVAFAILNAVLGSKL